MERIRLSGPSYRIGTATLTLGKTFCDRSFETASWYQEVACEPQTVPLLSDGYWCHFAFEGTIATAYFPSSLFGVTSLNPDDAKKVGRPASFRYTVYDYQLAKWIGTGSGLDAVTFALDEEYGVMSTSSETRLLWRLTMPGSGHPLEVRETGRERDPDHYFTTWVTYGVSYRGEARGDVRVRAGQFEHQSALRAAEALVFDVEGERGSGPRGEPQRPTQRQ